MVTVKRSCYRPGVAQRVGRGVALLFHDRGTRRGWVVSSTPRPHFTPGKDPVPILQETGWAPGPVWTGGKSRPHRDSFPDRPACSQSLYRLSYSAHNKINYNSIINIKTECYCQRRLYPTQPPSMKFSLLSGFVSDGCLKTHVPWLRLEAICENKDNTGF